MIKFSVVTAYGVNLADGMIQIPRYAVRGSYTNKHGKRVHVWVEDTRRVCGSWNFTVRMFPTSNGDVGVCTDRLIRGAIRRFIESLPADQIRRPDYTITHADIRACGAPRDRVIPEYMQRGRPGRGDNPRTITQNSVTAGCVVGKVRLTEEGYACTRMGVTW